MKITKHSLAILVQKESTKCVRLEGVVQHCLGGKICNIEMVCNKSATRYSYNLCLLSVP